MGNAGAEAMGLKEAPVTLEQCIAGMVEVVSIEHPVLCALNQDSR